jgi:hypothetical protein
MFFRLAEYGRRSEMLPPMSESRKNAGQKKKPQRTREEYSRGISCALTLCGHTIVPDFRRCAQERRHDLEGNR